MADILISAVSAAYTGTENADDFSLSKGNLRDITVQGLSGSDLLNISSPSTGGGSLGYSIGSSELVMGAGDDTIDFEGSDATGRAQFRSTNIFGNSGSDLTRIIGIASASASTIRAGSGDDDIRFNNLSGGGETADSVRINGNAGNDEIVFNWSGTEINGLSLLAGQGNDAISATFNVVSANAAPVNLNASGAKVGGNKGDDEIDVNILGSSDQVKVNGNSGSDTIVVTAAADNVSLGIAGGKGDDLISAFFAGANSSEAATVAGSLGNDTVGVTFSGGNISGFQLNGGSGADALTFTNAGVVLTAASANIINGGSGADTITFNLGANLAVTGASGFVADLGGDAGGVIDVHLSAALTARTGAGAFFRGTTTGDDIDVSNQTGANGLFNVTFSAEDGADTITLETESGGRYSATNFNAGSGADLITAQLGINTNFAVATGGRLAFDGGSGSDTIVLNAETGSTISAGLFDGNAGTDSISLNVLSGGTIAVVNSGTELAGGLGNDTISINGENATTIAAVIRAGDGNDLITGTIASGGVTNGAFTANAGDGADTIAFTYTAAASGGITILGAQGGVFDGGSGVDSITVVGAAVSGGTFNFGLIQGGEGNDTITFGGQLGQTADVGNFTGQINAGAGSDSIIFSGNNVISGGTASFAGGDGGGSAGFIFASGDSVVGGFDTVTVSNEDITGGQATLIGTFGSAGFIFTGYNDSDAGAFSMKMQTAGINGAAVTTGGGFNFGQAIFTSDGVSEATIDGVVLSGGLIGGMTAGGNASAGSTVAGTFILSGGSTLGQIFSAVDGMTIGRGAASVFNVQNGSGGSIDGFLFVQGGIITDTIVKFEGHGVTAAAYTRGEGYFSAGETNAIDGRRTEGGLDSGGQIFFGGNVGVG